jgi:hypothetical protein
MIIMDSNPKLLWLLWIAILLREEQYDTKIYFWRTTQQQEIDYIEESSKGMLAVEFKWNPDAKRRFPTTFLNVYPEAETISVTPASRDDFLGG